MLKIIFEDDDILVIDKPAGLVVDRSQTNLGPTLEEILAEQYNNLPTRSGLVHRLDKDTSGLILVAKSYVSLANLQDQFKSREVKKEYSALVHGVVESPGRVEGAIGRNPGNRQKFAVLEEGKEAATEYEPEKQFTINSDQLRIIFLDFSKIQLRKLERMGYGQFTLLKCQPLTGRTHQIRVHLKYTGHPIVADEKYVGRRMYRLDQRWCPRQFLHAVKLGFTHPVSGRWLELESPLPEDLVRALDILK